MSRFQAAYSFGDGNYWPTIEENELVVQFFFIESFRMFGKNNE